MAALTRFIRRIHPDVPAPVRFVTACLLGACERKDASADATLPNHAETRLGLRDADKRAVVTRREREVKADVCGMIGRLATSDTENGRLLEELEEAIQEVDPSQFEAIWKAFEQVEPYLSRDLRLGAVYHLAARGDLAEAGRIAREIVLPLYPEEERLAMLQKLVSFGQDGSKVMSYLEFMREVSPEERDILLKFTPIIGGSLEIDHLVELIGSGQRLSSGETRLVIETFGGPFAGSIYNRPVPPEGRDNFRKLLATVRSGEEKGFFAKGAHDQLLNIIGRGEREFYLENVPPEKLEQMMELEGSEATIEGIIFDEAFPLPDQERFPSTFFTATGTRHLPEGKKAIALKAWHALNPDMAQAWLADNGEQLTASQRDLAYAGFAENEGKGPGNKAQGWLDRIGDTGIRAKAQAEFAK